MLRFVMIKNFKHKGLKKYFETGKITAIKTNHANRLSNILALLNVAAAVEDMDLPGLNLHELKGRRKGTYSVRVSGNWRVTFQFKSGEVYSVDYEDYH